MDRFTELSIFLAAAEHGNFTAAARALGMTPSAVSKSITRQEDRLGVLLFQRNSRSVKLTSEGASFYASGVAAREAMDFAEASVSASRGAPSGTLRIHMMPMLAKLKLFPILTGFQQQYPEIDLELHIELKEPDPVRDGVDVILRSGLWQGSDITTRRIGMHHSVVCASPNYLKQHGQPNLPADLKSHNCLARLDRKEWVFQKGDDIQHISVTGSVSCSSSELLIEFARAGIGIIRISEMMVAKELADGSLERILQDYEFDNKVPIYIAYIKKRHLSPKIRAFVDYVAKSF